MILLGSVHHIELGIQFARPARTFVIGQQFIFIEGFAVQQHR